MSIVIPIAVSASPDCWRWNSHTPDVRAKQATADLQSTLEKIAAACEAAGLDQAAADLWFAKATKLFQARWSALGRCASAMVTGPANFNTRRNNKALSAEHKRLGELCDFLDNYKYKIARQARIAEQQKVAVETGANKEYEIGGVRVLENAGLDRIQLFFDGKPEADTIAALRGKAFKWSPTNKCWQRQLTDNARVATARLLRSIAATGAA